MSKKLLFWPLLLPIAFTFIGNAYAEVTPEQRLLEQVKFGEATNKYDLVQQALRRLEAIDPNNPELIAARLRAALRQNDQTTAQAELERLKQQAPDSAIYRQAKIELALSTESGRQQLQQARLLSTAGRLQEARQAYDQLFAGPPPTLPLAVEYWQLIARIPGQRTQAISQLQTLDSSTPGNPALRTALVTLLFSEQRSAEGFTLLQKMLDDPATADNAATIWLEQVKAMPVSNDSVAKLQQLQALYNGDPQQQVQQLLSQQQKQLADPQFIARQRGLTLVEQGGSTKAIGSLNTALKSTPDDSEVLGALGLAYARQGDRTKAISLFEQAKKANVNGYQSDKWQSLIDTNRYWLLIQQGDDALKANNLPLAEQRYRQAEAIDKTDSYALSGLGDVALAQHNLTLAENNYRKALRLDPNNSSALSQLVTIYQQQSPDKALAFINKLSPAQNRTMDDTIDRLYSNILQQQATQYEQQQQWQQAVDKLELAQQYAPDDVWLYYRLARNLRQNGQTAKADALFEQLAARHANDPQQVYAYALYLSSSDRDAQALQHMNTLATDKWDSDMHALASRLQLNQTLSTASKQREQGNAEAAVAYLQQQPANTRINLTLADWAMQDGDFAEALEIYQQILHLEPKNQDALLGKAEAYAAQDRPEQAHQLLYLLPASNAADSTINQQRRIADVWAITGEPQKAQQILQPLKAQAQAQSPSQDSALFFRDSARIERQLDDSKAALQDYRQAMAASGIAKTPPQDDLAFTRLSRNNADDDWLKRSIRSDSDDLYRQQNPTVTLGHDYSGSSGTGGMSDLKAHTSMLQIDIPLSNGRAFARTDFVQMDVGSFAADANGVYNETFGTCNTVGCSTDYRQKATGTSLAIGWDNERWHTDIGTTPMGFEVVDVVGGVSYSGDIQHIGWTLGASRRPVSSSLLAFGGTKDPYTGITWGGVRATGANLGLSYDRGEAHGVWADFGGHRYTGKNVEDNQRASMMAGYYYKLINENNRRFSIGLNTMVWRYQKDLSNYSLGQGGYYSPQRYFSLSIPLNYRQRTENWSWELAGSGSWSQSTTHNQPRYPLQQQVTLPLPDRFAIEEGSRSSGFGYTLLGVVERRLTSHWSIGAGVDIQQAKDYTPSHGFMYLRYSFNGWQGDLDMPPQPLIPYANF